MYYVYCESYYSVYEPAEGGYYVCASQIDDCVTCETIEEAYKEFIESVWQAEEQGCKLHKSCFDTRIFFDEIDGEKERRIAYPWAEFDYTGYIGDGFMFAISTEKPKDKPYRGYC